MSPENGSESKTEFKPGQVWQYNTRPGEEDSMLIILDLEGRTAHVHLKHIKLTTPSGQEVKELFLPIGVDALRESVTSRVPDKENAMVHQAMVTRWQAQHDTRGQGQFDRPLAELLQLLAEGKGEEA